MPLVDDQFAGHFFPADPRSNLTGAFGCTWPTVPAYRYLISAPEATGFYFGFRAVPPLVELITDIDDHNVARWELVGTQPPWDFVRWDKLPIDTEFDGFEWVLTWKLALAPETVTNSFIETTPRKCNYDVDLPDWTFGGVAGSMGAGAVAAQVLWDQTEPPT